MLVLAALLATAAPSPHPAPAEIYRSALRRLAQLPQPAYIDTVDQWKVLAEGSQGDQRTAFDERVLFDSATRRECVLFVPYSPTSRFIIGPSYFAPDMWLVRHVTPAPLSRAKPAPSAQPNFAPDLSDLRTIANVVAVAKPSYDITEEKTVQLTNGGGTAYHLVLKPRENPWLHNLRELWVNARNFDIVRAVIVGDYRMLPGQLVERTTVAEDFGQVGPYWVVIHHTWSYRDAPNGITYHYDATAVKMSFPAQIPAWYFDSAQFARHRSEVNTTSEWE